MKKIFSLSIPTLFFGLALNTGFSQDKPIAEVVDDKDSNVHSTGLDIVVPQNIVSLKAQYGITDKVFLYTLASQDIDEGKLKKLDDIVKFKERNVVKDCDDPGFNALCYDVIAIGKIVDVNYFKSRSTCFHTEYTVEVKKYEKSPKGFNNRFIKIIQVAGPLDGNVFLESSGSPNFDRESEYLFFLSNSRLKYFIEQNNCVDKYAKDVFFASKKSVPTSKGEYLIEGKGYSYKEVIDLMRPVLEVFKQN